MIQFACLHNIGYQTLDDSGREKWSRATEAPGRLMSRFTYVTISIYVSLDICQDRHCILQCAGMRQVLSLTPQASSLISHSWKCSILQTVYKVYTSPQVYTKYTTLESGLFATHPCIKATLQETGSLANPDLCQ